MTEAMKKHVASLLQLHALFILGIDEGIEADEIRDGVLQETWCQLTNEERERVRNMSEALYKLVESEP